MQRRGMTETSLSCEPVVMTGQSATGRCDATRTVMKHACLSLPDR
jgi:hypothetical protein